MGLDNFLNDLQKMCNTIILEYGGLRCLVCGTEMQFMYRKRRAHFPICDTCRAKDIDKVRKVILFDKKGIMW